MARRTSDSSRVDTGNSPDGSASKSGTRREKVDDLNRRYLAWTLPKWSGVQLDPARKQLEMCLTAEIETNLDANSARLDEFVAIRDIDDHRVSDRARRFELPAEGARRREQLAKAERRGRRLRRLKVVSVTLGLIAYCVGLVAAGVMLPFPEELVFIGLVAPVIVAVVAVAKRLILPVAPSMQLEYEGLTTEALIMQRFLDLADEISATGAWQSDVSGRLDLDVEQHDIASQLRQMEALGASIASLAGSDDDILVHALRKERARLTSVRVSIVDRLAALDRYRASLEQVDIDTDRAAKFSKVDEISSAMDMLEVGRVSSEFSIDHTTRASEQLDQSIRMARRMLEELRGFH